MEVKPTIVIIDDLLERPDPLIDGLEEKYDNVHLIDNSNNAIDFIKSNLDKNLIIILDLKFPGNQINGDKLLNKIHELSSIIPIIIWTGEADLFTDKLKDFINNHAFGFFSKSTIDFNDIIRKIDEAVNWQKAQTATALEEWILLHPAEDREKPYVVEINGKVYTLNNLLIEIRKRTEVGVEFENAVNKLTIEKLLNERKDK